VYKRFEIDGASWSTYGRCVGSSNASNTFLIILGVLNVVVLFLALFQAWKARNISDEFSETKIVGGAVSRRSHMHARVIASLKYSHYSSPAALWLAAAPDSRRTSGVAHFRR
jgi:high-affinity nickel permease